MQNTSVLKVAGQLQQENADKLQRLYGDTRYQDALRQLKYKISNGRTLDEARMEMSLANDKFWENLVSLLGLFTFNPHSVFVHHHIKTQTRYEQATEIYLSAKACGDLELAGKMIILMARLDEGSVEVWDRLRLLIPKPIDPVPFVKEEMTEAEKLERAHQLRDEIDEFIKSRESPLEASDIGLSHLVR